MGYAKIIVEMQRGSGKSFQNEWAVCVNGTPGKPTDAEMEAIGCGKVYDDLSTNPGNGNYASLETSVIGHILAWHRLMQFGILTITRVYVTDALYQGPRLPGQPYPGTFWTSSLALPMIRGGQDLNQTVAPGNSTLRITKEPRGFGSFPGQLYLRGALLDADIRFDESGALLGWSAPAVLQTYQDLLVATDFATGIGRFYGDGSAADDSHPDIVYIGIGQRRGGEGTGIGTHKDDLINVIKMTTTTVDGPRGRQAKRGKQRKQ